MAAAAARSTSPAPSTPRPKLDSAHRIPSSRPSSSNGQKENDRSAAVDACPSSRQGKTRSPVLTPSPKGSRSFMAPTISASSKAVMSSSSTSLPRKKVLGERNEGPAREQLCAAPPVFDVSPAGPAAENGGSGMTTTELEPVLDVDPTLPPYDPKTNYLSPRPRFLHYKPNRRIELLMVDDNGDGGLVGDSRRLDESFSSVSDEDATSVTGEQETVLLAETSVEDDNSVAAADPADSPSAADPAYLLAAAETMDAPAPAMMMAEDANVVAAADPVDSPAMVKASTAGRVVLAAEVEIGDGESEADQCDDGHKKSHFSLRRIVAAATLLGMLSFLSILLLDSPATLQLPHTLMNSSGQPPSLYGDFTAERQWPIYLFEHHSVFLAPESFGSSEVADLRVSDGLDEADAIDAGGNGKTELDELELELESPTPLPEVLINESIANVEDDLAEQENDGVGSTMPEEVWLEEEKVSPDAEPERQGVEADGAESSEQVVGAQDEAMELLSSEMATDNGEKVADAELSSRTSVIEYDNVGQGEMNTAEQLDDGGQSSPQLESLLNVGLISDTASLKAIMFAVIAIIVIATAAAVIRRRLNVAPSPALIVSQPEQVKSQTFEDNYKAAPTIHMERVGDSSGPSEFSSTLNDATSRSSMSAGRGRPRKVSMTMDVPMVDSLETPNSAQPASRRDSEVLSSSTSYGSFTSFERIHLKKGRTDDEAITPVRRSSRLRNHIVSP